MARERWGNRSAFIMAAIGSAIGLGNVWRFPYEAYSNGGGAFFIPYVIALITTGIPLVALEYYLGVRHQTGPSEAYGFIRKHTNYIGWFALGTAGMITAYYAVIMGWSWTFLYHSIGVKWAGVEKEFFHSNILGISDHITNFGGLQWPIIIGLFLTWLSIFLIIFKGVKIVGKVVNWTVGLPWLMLFILIIRGITLKGAGGGLDYYLKPEFSQLLNPNVWLAAYGQIFFSLSLGFGIMIAYASYLPKDSDINTNAWIVSFANCATSFFAGFAVFSILGYLAFHSGVPVDQVVDAGPGLVFVTYPAAIAQLPGGIIAQSIFGILFFIMLLTLGIDSAFSLSEAIVTGLKDSFKIKRETVVLWVCSVGFLIGLFYASRAGLYWLDVVDHWMNWGLVIVGLLEAILIGWFYNTKKVIQDMDSTSAIKFGNLWVFSVKYFTPAILLITIISSIVKEITKPYGGGSYPIWTLMLGGWIMLITILYISIIIQNRNEFTRMKNMIIKIAGGILSYLGFCYSFYLFYSADKIIYPISVLIISIIVAFLTFVERESKNIKEIKKSEIK
ncbi:MAG: sodium-dependent transporter [Candidatus Cloacimonadota bacterium]|nr:sodium-dependent transporter [Candidatus Cloacimonadota bacterium]